MTNYTSETPPDPDNLPADETTERVEHVEPDGETDVTEKAARRLRDDPRHADEHEEDEADADDSDDD